MSVSSVKNDEITFKSATASDIPVLVDLLRKYYEYDHIPFDEPQIHRGIATFLDDPSLALAWLVMRGERAVGYVILAPGLDLEFGGRQGTLTDLYLEPDERGKGTGRRTIEFIEDYCRAAGMRALELLVERRNTRAAAFYQNIGFHAHDRILMSKRLVS